MTTTNSYPKPGMVSMSSFSYLFSELVQYSQSKVSNTGDLERRLEEVGRCVGGSLVELVQSYTSSSASSTYDTRQAAKLASPYLTRHTRLLDVLRYIYTTIWKYLFGKQAQDLQQSNDADDEYMISDDEVYLWMGRYVSVPKDMGTFNCHAFLAGVVRGVLDEAGFETVRVTAHFVPLNTTTGVGGPSDTTESSSAAVKESSSRGTHHKVTVLIKFSPEVMERERMLSASENSN